MVDVNYGLWIITGVAVLGFVVTETFVSRARKRNTIGWLKVPTENWIGVAGAAITLAVLGIVFAILLA